MALDPELEAIVAEVPGWAGRDLVATPLPGGITNRNVRVEVDGEAFVVRIPGRDTELLGIDRRAEHAAALAAAEAGVGPDVVAFVPSRGALVTRFLEGAAPIPEVELRTRTALEPVVRAVRAFHACPPIPGRFPVFRVIERYREVAEERGVAIPSAYDEAHAVAARIEAAFSATPITPVPCHDDLLNANLLRRDGRVWLVDFEYAGMGDPYFDLANLAVNNGLDEPAQDLLLELAFGAATDARRARLALMRIVSDLREAMWGVVQQGISTLDVDYVDYAERHFARCLASASDERVGAWLDAVRGGA
ncbi:MAG: choline kinase [Actinomycetota bacterium]|nr:MAG: choline kinase [Actinomycetota bacterium]